MKVRVGKFLRTSEMSQTDWLASPIWELRQRADEYHARPIFEPPQVSRGLLSGRRILVLVWCEQFDRHAIAEVHSTKQLVSLSVFWRNSWRQVDRLATAKFPFYVVAVPPFGRQTGARFVWKAKRSRGGQRVD